MGSKTNHAKTKGKLHEENFGLLFYTMDGPRLFFVQSGPLIREAFLKEKSPLIPGWPGPN
jgi:hypothetical protein